MSKEMIVAEIEKLCRKFGSTSDPVRKAEINCEIENLSWMLEEGGAE